MRNASPSLQHRYAAVDAQERQEAARVERERQMLLEQRQADDIALSVRMAEQRGELLTMRQRQEGVGRTIPEALEYYSALQDIEDARVAAQRAKKLRELELRDSGSWSVDTSAPSEVDVAELAAMREKAGAYRSRRRELRGIKDETLAEVWRRWIAPKGASR